MKIYNFNPAYLRDGDTLCDDNGVPFATINGVPLLGGGAVWVDTTFLPVEYPFGTTVTVERPEPDVPQPVINAVIVAVMRDEAFSQRHADMWAEHGYRRDYQYCDMRPVVHRAESLGEENEWGDSWIVEVQYSSKGGRAVYGVNRNYVPNCYAN